jgi:hypothetical protein
MNLPKRFFIFLVDKQTVTFNFMDQEMLRSQPHRSELS